MKNNDTLIEQLRRIFVDWNTFNLRLSPVEKIVYGACATIGLAVLGGLLTLIIRK